MKNNFVLIVKFVLIAQASSLTAFGIDRNGNGIPDEDEESIPPVAIIDSDGDGISDADEGYGDADGDGLANYLDLDSDADGLSDANEGGFDSFEHRSVNNELVSTINIALPESKNVSASFLNSAYRTDLTFGVEASITVTFLDEGAGFRNSLGYYSYDAGVFDSLNKQAVDTDGSGVVSLEELQAVESVEIGWVFPNVSKSGAGGSLLAGDTVALGNYRKFAAGKTIGFFLVQNAWLNGSIKQPDASGTSPQVFYTTDFLNPEASSLSDRNEDSSLNRSRHVALLFADADREDIIMGFEDLNRVDRTQNHWSISSDEDFNDAVFIIKSSPENALNTAGIPTVSDQNNPDSDGDGILDLQEFDGDSDGDGILDYLDPDDDGDGIVTPSEGNGDNDSDGIPNYLDTDSDNDGVLDQVEGAIDSDLDGTPDFLDTDSDNDGLLDRSEVEIDSDGDGLSNRVDFDDDGDTIGTIEEGVNDYDKDGIPDYLDSDSDNDSIPDRFENEGDSDGDGLLDRNDTDDDNDGIPSSAEGYEDSDEDGLGNQVDLDSDNDNIVDRLEADQDTDGDGLDNRIDSDDDGDGLATALESIEDTDNDGTVDYLDTDSDNDGLEDGVDFVNLSVKVKALQQDYEGVPLISGDQIEYTVSIKNEGMETAYNVSVSGLVPSNTEYVLGSLLVDDVPNSEVLSEGNSLDITAISGGEILVISLLVEVQANLPENINSISCVVIATHAGSRSLSDNDPEGHCGIVDDGIDSLEDFEDFTDDDDPCVLPLLQGTVVERCYLAFEDLQNAGWCDWDMNDLVVDISTYYVLNGNDEVESLVSTYQLLARGAGMDSELMLTLPFAGYGAWQTLYIDFDGFIEKTATGSAVDMLTVSLWDSSQDALPPFTDLKYQWGAARTERFDSSPLGKVAVVNIYFDSPASNSLDAFPPSPHDTWAYIPATDQEIHQIEYSVASSQMVTEGPLFGRSLPFVMKFDTNFTWAAEGQAIWDSHPVYVDYIKSGRTGYLDWSNTIDIWRVWFDDTGMMSGREEANPAATSEVYENYVETHRKP